MRLALLLCRQRDRYFHQMLLLPRRSLFMPVSLSLTTIARYTMKRLNLYSILFISLVRPPQCYGQSSLSELVPTGGFLCSGQRVRYPSHDLASRCPQHVPGKRTNLDDWLVLPLIYQALYFPRDSLCFWPLYIIHWHLVFSSLAL